MERLDYATALADAGFHVFPLAAGQKIPAHKGWQAEATRDPEQLRQWFAAPSDFNIGIYTGKFGDSGALLVVDIDRRAEKDGEKALFNLELEGCEFPATLETQTPGGRHLFFSVPSAVKQGANVLGPGIDTRSAGGYVVAPGSVVNGKPYQPAGNPQVVPAPQWLIDRCGRPRERAEVSPAPAADIDPERAADRARAYLLSDAPAAVQGRGGDTATYRVAARLKDFGLTEDAAYGAMAEHWNGRCSPLWSLDELRTKVRNAYAYGNEAPGSAAPELQFKPVAPSPEAPTASTELRPRLYFETFGEVTPVIDKPALVEGLLDHGALSVLYGESNTGKTFVALDIAFHVATGAAWQTKAAEQAAVVYVAAEGGGNIKKRIAALRIHHKTGSAPLALVPCPIDLSGAGADVGPLVELVASAAAKIGPIKLVVIDTLARAMGGGNENASEEMGALIRNVDRIRAETEAHVLLVHHSGKDKAKGARGHSSLRAAVDTEIEIEARKITITKQRDMEIGGPLGFDLESVTIGQDARGRAVTSCVVVSRNPVTVEFPSLVLKVGSVPAKALTVLQDISPAGSPVLIDRWREEFIGRHYPRKRKVGDQAFNRACEAIIAAGRAKLEGGLASPVH
jgi:KaiC/GvpD/RAD55 family RecA-like ATPase